MEWTKLKSSNLKGARYNAKKKILDIEFQKSGKYAYHEVPEEVFDNLCNAESPGKFFFSNIKGKFKHVNLNEKEEDKS